MIRFQPGGTMDEMVEAYLGRQNLDPPRTIECSSPAPVVELIASGLGWTITAPFNVAYFRVLQGKAACMPLPQPLSTRDIFLIANAGRYLDVPSILAKACRAALREETRSWRGGPNEMLAQAVRIDSD
jgi:DNA-binding transcriptional LysR family regulator